MTVRRVQVEVHDVELSCCGGPLGIGDRVGWSLLLSTDPDEGAGDAVDTVWTVTALSGSARHLDGGDLCATWVGSGPPPPLGISRLSGHLSATWHGGTTDEDLTTSAARIERIQVVSRARRPPHRGLTPAGQPADGGRDVGDHG